MWGAVVESEIQNEYDGACGAFLFPKLTFLSNNEESLLIQLCGGTRRIWQSLESRKEEK